MGELLAAEQLVVELAAGRVGTDFETTEDQKELNIPPFLVYLFGIVIAEDEYQQWKDQKSIASSQCTSRRFSPIREKRFISFQKKYFASAKIASVHGVERLQTTTPSLESKPYKLTSRIFPSDGQQAIVKRDLLQECEKLESISNEALESLLREESSSSRKTDTKSKRKLRKKKNKQQSVTNRRNDIAVIKDGKEAKETRTEEVVATALHNPFVDMSKEENACVETKSKCNGVVREKSSSRSLDSDGTIALTSNGLVVKEILKGESDDSMGRNEGSSSMNSTGHDPSSDIFDNSNEKRVSSLTNGISHVENVAPPINMPSSPLLPPNTLSNVNTAANIHDSAIDTSELSKLTRRVSDLENDLAKAKRRSKEENLAHAQALRKEKERYENLIQALQLRLYISENKVRTYEDALGNHIESVCAINNSFCAMKKENEEETISCSPSLISKVLQNRRAAENREV